MNWDVVEGNWTQFKAAARIKWGKLTDSDWDQVGGKMERMLGVMQERYGYKKEQALDEVDKIITSLKPEKPVN